MPTFISSDVEDDIFREAAHALVNERYNVRETQSAQDFGRFNRAKNILLKGAISLFSNNDAIVEDFDTANNERYVNSMVWDMLHGVQFPYMDKMPSEEPEDYLVRPGKATANYFGLAVKILTQLYKDPPNRLFKNEDAEEIDEDDARKIQKLYERGSFNRAMMSVDKFCRAFGECLLRPVLVDAETKDYQFMIHPKTEYDLFIKKNLATGINEIKAIVLHETKELEVSNDESRLQHVHTVWTDKKFGVFEDAEQISDSPNPYGVIPYVFCTQDTNFAARFKQETMHEYALANAEFNEEYSLHNYLMRFNSMPVTVITDGYGDDQPDFKNTPGFGMNLTSPPSEAGAARQARFEFITPADRSQALTTALENVLTNIFRPLGINYTMKEGVKAGVSGIAVEVSMAPVLNELKARAPVDIGIENRLYQLFRKVFKVEIGEDLPEVDRVDVEYGLSMSVRSEMDRREEVKFMLEDGLISKAQALRFLQPQRYLTDAEAEEALPEEEEPKEPVINEADKIGLIGANPGDISMNDGADQGEIE